MLAPSKLFQPFSHFFFCFRLRINATIEYGALSPGYSFEKPHPFLHHFVVFNINQIRRWLTVLSD